MDVSKNGAEHQGGVVATATPAPVPASAAAGTAADGPVPCPVCGSATERYLSKTAYGQAWHLNRCPACGHGFVANRPDFETLVRIYSTETSHHSIGDGRVVAGDGAGAGGGGAAADIAAESAGGRAGLVDRLAVVTRERGDSLDVGSGDGFYSYHLHRHGFRPVMIDLDPRAEQLSARVPGGTFYRSTYEDFTHPRPFAAIVMSQVLEHALDPLGWLRRARDLLVPGGGLAVALPNFTGVYRLLGKRDPFLIPPVHLNYFTARSLRLAFEAAGFEPVGFDSTSQISVAPARRGSLKWRVVGRSWNVLSRVIDPTARGIILQGYARRKP